MCRFFNLPVFTTDFNLFYRYLIMIKNNNSKIDYQIKDSYDIELMILNKKIESILDSNDNFKLAFIAMKLKKINDLLGI
jgi:tmRNA-binding protein